MHYCCEICICFSSTQTQGHKYTNAVEEAITLRILSLSQSLLMDQSHYKTDKVTAKISKCPVTPQLGLLCLPSTEKQTQVREKKKDREGTRERENWWWKRRVKEGEEGVSICPSPGSHWSVGSEGWVHRKSVGIPRRSRKGKQSLCFSPCPIL